ncbi:MAG: DUF1249 domain-containing protein [Nevskiaceae bacterium]|nr:MAG: DUF1249 domain-containing protein [Nevskiaceae bacterium]TBR74021.1 MAG: DUF1249 domain-containing protein [Nevskiaceae bacterium]
MAALTFNLWTCPCCGHPRGLGHLIDLYERNFRLLARLVPELELPFNAAISRAADEPLLGLEVVSRSRYTSEICLRYCFAAPEEAVQSEVRVRVCRDAGTAEALSPVPPEQAWPLATGEGQDAEQFLHDQWHRNHFLNRWLEYLLARGHGFVLAERPRGIPAPVD